MARKVIRIILLIAIAFSLLSAGNVIYTYLQQSSNHHQQIPATTLRQTSSNNPQVVYPSRPAPIYNPRTFDYEQGIISDVGRTQSAVDDHITHLYESQEGLPTN